MKGMDKNMSKLIKLISDKYATENGKKFILHLVSAFVIDKSLIKRLTSDVVNSFDESKGRMKYGEIKCCITKVPIAPMDIYVPVTEGEVSYGWISKKSDKMLSDFAFNCLQAFVDMRVESGDDMLTKIHNYINKKSEDKIKPIKKQVKVDTQKVNTIPNKVRKSDKPIRPSKPVEPKDPRFAALKEFKPEVSKEVSIKSNPRLPKVEKEIKESRAESESLQAIPE